MFCYEKNNSHLNDELELRKEVKFINKKLLNTENEKFKSVRKSLLSISTLIVFSFTKTFENQEIFWLDLMLVGLVGIGIGFSVLICLQVSRYKCLEDIKVDLLNKIKNLKQGNEK